MAYEEYSKGGLFGAVVDYRASIQIPSPSLAASVGR